MGYESIYLCSAVVCVSPVLHAWWTLVAERGWAVIVIKLPIRIAHIVIQARLVKRVTTVGTPARTLWHPMVPRVDLAATAMCAAFLSLLVPEVARRTLSILIRLPPCW